MTDEAQEPTQRTLGDYLTKPATTLQERFANWLQEEVGYNPNGAKTKLEAFQEGVRLATATRMVFQASDYNREARAAEQEAKAAAEEAEAETPAPPTKKAAPTKKVAPAKRAAKKANPAPVEEPEQEESEIEAPVQAVKKAPARRAPARRTTSASAAAAPF